MTEQRLPVLAPPPHIYASRTSAGLIWGIAALLLPACLWGLYCFGPAAGLPLVAAVAAALAGELLVGLMLGRFTLDDGSALLTGLLIGMAMPPASSPLIAAASAFFAVVVVKGAFGGLGSNWMNPALAGTAFALINWPSGMAGWISPLHLSQPEALSGATPLGLVNQGMAAASTGPSPLGFLSSLGFRFSALDAAITDLLNQQLFSRLGAELPQGYIDLIAGNKAGALGELSGLLILGASVVLIAGRFIKWEIPAAIIGSFSLLVWIFGGLSLGGGFFRGDVLFSLFTGSLLLVSFFMATDPVTSPSSRLGMLCYGVGIGCLTFLFRRFSGSGEGSAYAVLLMNCLVPLISRMHSRMILRVQGSTARPHAKETRHGA